MIRWLPLGVAQIARHFLNSMPNMTPHPGSANDWVTALSSTARSNIPASKSPATFKTSKPAVAEGKGQAPGLAGFLPVVAPASALPGAKNEHYKDEETFLFALADALHEEYQAIVDAGLYVQIDDAFFPYMYERMVPPMTAMRIIGAGPAAAHRCAQSRAAGYPRGTLALSHLLGQLERPACVRCAARRTSSISFSRSASAHYSFEAANPRHAHEWRVWENVKLPPGKVLIPGVISHATNIVEHPELVAERIVRLANIVGRENVIGGTDCGFAQSPFARRVHPRSCGRS